MAVDKEFEAASAKHTAKYRQRRGVALDRVCVEVTSQNKLDLEALARARSLTLGEMIDKLVEGQVARQARKMRNSPEVLRR